MDTSTSQNPLHVRVRDLMNSEFDDVRESAKEFQAILVQLLGALMPVLKYVCHRIDFDCKPLWPALGETKCYHSERCVAVGAVAATNHEMFLSEKGEWLCAHPGEIIVYEDRNKIGGSLRANAADWELAYFDELITGLQTVLNEALKKRDEHTASLKRRSDMLNSIGAVIRCEAVLAQAPA